MTKQTVFSTLKSILAISFGLLCYACAWNIFVLPHGFVGGGLGGICAMIFYKTGVPIAVTYLGFNVILCTIAWIILGRDFSIKTVVGILGLTAFLGIIPVPEAPVLSDRLLSAVMGGIVAGTGCALYLTQGASTGGSDIIVMVISKYKNVSWGKVYLMFDACVIGASYFLPTSTLETVAYGYIFMGVSAYTIDTVSNGRRQSVQMFIFTSKYREIADAIIHQHHRGATLLESVGWYTKQHRKTIFLVAKKRESQDIFRSVKAIDPHAFIAVSNVMSVFGTGFDAIKAGFTKAVLKDSNGKEIKPKLADKRVDHLGLEAVSGGGDDDESTFVFVPKGGIVERAVNEELMRDENDALKRIEAGRENQYDPNWETPISELMEIAEMPSIPKELVAQAVRDEKCLTTPLNRG